MFVTISYHTYDNKFKSYCNQFEITSALEKHMVEDDILFTNHF